MLITEIKSSKKCLTSVLLSEDLRSELGDARFDERGALMIDSKLLSEKSIKVGNEVSFADIEKLAFESECKRAYSRAAWYLERRDYSKGELCRKLASDFKVDVCQIAVDKMEAYGYINDEKYAAHKAEIFITERGFSKRMAQQKLMQLRIDKELAEFAVSNIECDPVAAIKELIKKKYKNKLSCEADVRRTFSAFMRRGFCVSDIKAALKGHIEEISEEY